MSSKFAVERDALLLIKDLDKLNRMILDFPRKARASHSVTGRLAELTAYADQLFQRAADLKAEHSDLNYLSRRSVASSI